MAYLPLTWGYFAIVDDEDFDRLRQWKWNVQIRNNHCTGARQYRLPEGRLHLRYLSYEVLRLPRLLPRGRCGDHINRDPLDCRKRNLRVCTYSQNSMNRNTKRGKKYSRYKGVTRNVSRGRWRARISYQGKRYSLGSFDNEYRAMHAYNCASIAYFGRYAYLNP